MNFKLDTARLRLVLMSGFFGTVSLVLIKFGIATKPNGHCATASVALMRALWKWHNPYLMFIANAFEWVGRQTVVLLTGSDSGMVANLKNIPWLGTIAQDTAAAGAFVEPMGMFEAFFSKLFGRKTHGGADGYLGLFALMVYVRLLCIGFGIFCNVIQMKHYCRLLSQAEASLAIALNFAAQFVFTGVFDVLVDGAELSWAWVFGSLLCVFGAGLAVLDLQLGGKPLFFKFTRHPQHKQQQHQPHHHGHHHHSQHQAGEHGKHKLWHRS